MESKCRVTDKGTIIWNRIDSYIIHREDGPAIEFADGTGCWYLDGYCYELEEMPLSLFLSYCKYHLNKK